MVCMEGYHRVNYYSPKKHISEWQKTNWVIQDTSGPLFCGLMTPRLSCTSRQNTKSSYQRWSMVEGALWFVPTTMGPGQFTVTAGTMNWKLHREIWLHNVVVVTVHDLKHDIKWMMQQVNDPYVQVNKQYDLRRRQFMFCKVLTLTHLLWLYLNGAIHARKPWNIEELKQFVQRKLLCKSDQQLQETFCGSYCH